MCQCKSAESLAPQGSPEVRPSAALILTPILGLPVVIWRVGIMEKDCVHPGQFGRVSVMRLSGVLMLNVPAATADGRSCKTSTSVECM